MIDNTDETFQNSAQRDIVVMATRTPQRQESGRDFVDKEWVCEHARQVGLYPKTLSLTIEIVSCLTQTSYIAKLIITVRAPLFFFSPSFVI